MNRPRFKGVLRLGNVPEVVGIGGDHRAPVLPGSLHSRQKPSLIAGGDLHGIEQVFAFRGDRPQNGQDAVGGFVDVCRIADTAVFPHQGRGLGEGDRGGVEQQGFHLAHRTVQLIQAELVAVDAWVVLHWRQSLFHLPGKGFGRITVGKKAD